MPPTEPPKPTASPEHTQVFSNQFQPAPASHPAVANTQPSNNDDQLTPALSLFGKSWELLKFNFVTFLLLGLAYIVPIILLVFVLGANSVTERMSATPTVSSNHATIGLLILAEAIFFLVFMVVYPAAIYTQLKSIQKQKVSIGDALQNGLRNFWRFLGLTILLGLAITFGFILLIVPGLILLHKFYYAPYVLMDKHVSINDSFHGSSALTKGHNTAVFGLFGVMILLTIPDIIPVVGQIVGPILYLIYFGAPAIRYTELKKLHSPEA